MHIGTKIHAPEGYQGFAKGVDYYCLGNDKTHQRVMLVKFDWKGRRTPMARLMMIARVDFEEMITNGDLIEAEDQSSQPPWQEPLHGINLWAYDAKRRHAKVSHIDRITQRILMIQPAIARISEILSAENPELLVNQFARSSTPPQNESRFRFWLFAYLCFGKSHLALMPTFHRIGHWKNSATTKKRGAPSKAFGRKHGHAMTEEIIAQSKDFYLKTACLGKAMKSIYVEAMIKVFKCKAHQVTERGITFLDFYHPENKPYPSFHQFRRIIIKTCTLETVQTKRLGQTVVRNEKSATKGKYSEAVNHLMERIEADGYYIKELPKGYVDGRLLKPICVVTSRDVLCGSKLGIGFAPEKESAVAYRMMCFSMAVPKPYFCMLFGIHDLPQTSWMNEGLPPEIKVDRGPGASSTLFDDIQDVDKKPVLRGLAPSWTPQSKATVESSHPRTIKIKGAPRYIQSNKTTIQLLRKEIMDLIRYNGNADMSDRIENDPEMVDILPTPNGIWEYYSNRFRNDAISISIDDAIRAFLTRIKVTVKPNGVEFNKGIYTSEALIESGIFDKAKQKTLTTSVYPGYMLDLCVRYIWIEINNKIELIAAKLKTNENEEILYVSHAEKSLINEVASIARAQLSVHQNAMSAQIMAQYKEDTGIEWDSSQSRMGTPKRDAVAQQEGKELRKQSAKRQKS